MFDERVWWMVAQERHRQRLAEAEAARLVKQVQALTPAQQRPLLHKVAWGLGAVLITVGQKLQARPYEDFCQADS